MKIDIKGVIIPNDEKWVYDWFEVDAVCPKDVLEAIEKANGEPVDTYINSPGGSIFSGSEIYSALRDYPGEVRHHIVGVAGSSASVVACSGWCEITPTGTMMIHNVSGKFSGDYHTMDKGSEILKTANKAISMAYQEKTGKSEEELLALMESEKWMYAKEAVELGFVDKISESKNIQLVASFGGMIPQEVIEKIRNEFKIPEDRNRPGFLNAKLNFLNLRRVEL